MDSPYNVIQPLNGYVTSLGPISSLSLSPSSEKIGKLAGMEISTIDRVLGMVSIPFLSLIFLTM